MIRTSSRAALLLAAIVAAALVAIPALAGHKTTQATTVRVTALDTLKFVVSPKTVKAGAVTFQVANKGKLSHDFKIAGKKTKLLKGGQSATLKVVLKKGKYPYLCTVPGHAAAGMKGTITAK